jgi:hypothetical protein
MEFTTDGHRYPQMNTDEEFFFDDDDEHDDDDEKPWN